MKRFTDSARQMVPDLLMFLGICLISYGAAQIYAPAGWISAGGFAFAFGFMAARRGGDA